MQALQYFLSAGEKYLPQLGGVIMAVPKNKVSKSRRDKRRANWKLSVPGMVECPQCHEYKMPHRVCKACGYYNGKEVIKTEA